MEVPMSNLRMAVSVAVLGMLAAACGNTKQVHATAPVGTTSMQAPANKSAPIVPNTPTAANISISSEILRACNIPDADAYFAFDSSRLTTFDSTAMQAVAKCFESGPLAGRQMHLVGHADPRGTTEYNMTLGQSRADAVASYLSGEGLRRTAVTTTSRGAMDATGTDETGWAHDRRVDVLLAN
jgi:peptidoglycan-associated lipoprotein